MPKEKDVTSHPCHLLSLPSAKRFWCRHCMTVFEDAITRWRHSRSCRYASVNNFMRRRELEAKALQNATVLSPVEARLEQSIQLCDLASASAPGEVDLSNQSQILPGSESFNCFICHQKFASMEEMRVHVKYPCSNNKIITSHVPHPKHSVPVFVDALPGRTHQWQPPSHQEITTFAQADSPQQNAAQMSYDIEIQSQQEMQSHFDSTSGSFNHGGSSVSDGITPTNIYVNEQGETVIEVENLDLNSEGGELSLAHLLTQLSQQGIVFDKTRTAELQTAHEVTVGGTSASALHTTNADYQNSAFSSKIVEEEQPTAEDAANTLAQLAGLRGFTRMGQIKPMGETPVHSQVQPVQNYSYNTLSPGPSRHYAVSPRPQIDIKYEYDYMDTPSSGGNTPVTDQEVALQQTIVSTPQKYENVEVEHEAVEDTINFNTDSSNITYVTDPDSHHQIQVETRAISSREYSKHGDDGPDGHQPVLIQHYPVHVDESGQLINVSTGLSAKHNSETMGNIVSKDLKAVGEDVPLPTAYENSALITSFETHISSSGPHSKEITSLAHENEMKSDARDSQISAETDEFTIQTVSLQEIVDSENSALTFVGQTQSRSQNEHFISHAPSMCPVSSEPISLAVTERLASQDNGSSRATSTAVSEMTETAAYPATLYIVTSSGIIPASSKKPRK